jgi:hypothetical protein
MGDSLSPFVTNMDIQTGVSIVCRQELQESFKQSKSPEQQFFLYFYYIFGNTNWVMSCFYG